MARKKKVIEAPALPVKSSDLRKKPATAKVARPLVEADYENFQQTMVARNRQRQDLLVEVNERMAAVRESKKKITELGRGIEKDLSIIEAGVIEEDRPCLACEHFGCDEAVDTEDERPEENPCPAGKLIPLNKPEPEENEAA